MKSFCVILMLFLTLVGCGGSKLEGKYANKVGMFLDFKNGKVIQGLEMTGMKVETDYKVEGNQIKILSPMGGAIIYTLLEDGSIDGMGGNFVKQVKKTIEGKYSDTKGNLTAIFHPNGQLELIFNNDLKATAKADNEVKRTYDIKGENLTTHFTDIKTGKSLSETKFNIEKDGSLKAVDGDLHLAKQ